MEINAQAKYIYKYKPSAVIAVFDICDTELGKLLYFFLFFFALLTS